MSRVPPDNLPPTARSIALIIASTPGVQDAQPGVLHQLLEFANRYTSQVLQDGLVYAEHAGRSGKLELDDITLAVQARVGWEFGGRIPKEHIHSLATQTNAIPLPAVPEVFGVRLPPSSDCLTAVDFDLVPNKPPPGVKTYDEEIEEVEESESDDEEEEEEDVQPTPAPLSRAGTSMTPMSQDHVVQDISFPISAIATPSDIEMLGTPGVAGRLGDEDGSEGEDEEGLFAGGDDDDSDGMEEVQTSLGTGVNGLKRKLVEEDDYD